MAESGLYDTDSEISSIANEDDSDEDSLLAIKSADADRAASSNSQQTPSEVNATVAQASKAIEAAEEGSPGPADAHPQPSSSSLGPPPRVREWYDEQTPLLDAGPAPPDYAAATAWRNADPGQDDTASIPMLNEPRHPLEAFLTSLASWTNWTNRKRWRKMLRRFAVCVCLVQLVIVCAVIATVILVRKKVRNVRPNEDHPVYNLLHPERYHPSLPWCQFESYSDLESSYIETSGIPDHGDFRFWETMEADGVSDLRDARITGTVELRPAPYWQKERMEIWFNAAVSKPWIAQLPEFALDKGGLEIHSPRIRRDPNTKSTTEIQADTKTAASDVCYDLWIRVYVAGGLENIELHTAHMDIDVGSGVDSRLAARQWDLDVQNTTNITTISGHVETERLKSRSIHIETHTGAINGFLLRFSDEMSLITGNGLIGGTILPFGNSTILAHPSDEVDTQHQGGHRLRKLHTSAEILGTYLEIYNPAPYDSRNTLLSYHYSESGPIYLHYGNKHNWQGNMDFRSSNGTIEIEGDDVEQLPSDGNRLPGSHVRAWQGNSDSEMRVETVSGDINVVMAGP